MNLRNWLFRKNKKPVDLEVDCASWNDGYIICENCLSRHMLNFYKPLSFSKCSKCTTPIFIPHKVCDYWLYKPLGSGGMGSVYKAVHCQTDEKYSVKLLQRDSKTDYSIVNALLREGEIGQQISGHPNLCPIVEYGNKDDEVYIVSNFLEGIRLDVLIDHEGAVSESLTLYLALQLLSALQYIYGKGYLYRDLKPQNIIINPNQMYKATLFDYGLCEKVFPSERCEEKEVIGSPMFLPPERCTLGVEGVYSEIYSLGMLLFYCLAGKAYYISKSVDELIKMHTRKMRFKAVSSILKDVNPDIILIIEKMIKREPGNRYQTYEEVFGEIKSIYDIYNDG
jgi:eukaryotic-like serine/threonine-protein kinase